MVDNFFCSRCEKRLSVIESIYASALRTYKSETYKSGTVATYGVLFRASLLWRIDNQNSLSRCLSVNHSKQLRRLLNEYLEEDPKYIKLRSIQKHKIYRRITYRLLRTDLSPGEPSFLFIHPTFNQPYVAIIHDTVLSFSFSTNYSNFFNKTIFGLGKEIFNYPINRILDEEIVTPLKQDDFKKINQEVVNTLAKNRMEYYHDVLDSLHQKLNGQGNEMYPELKSAILLKLDKLQLKEGRKFRNQDFFNTIKAVLSPLAKG